MHALLQLFDVPYFPYELSQKHAKLYLKNKFVKNISSSYFLKNFKFLNHPACVPEYRKPLLRHVLAHISIDRLGGSNLNERSLETVSAKHPI